MEPTLLLPAAYDVLWSLAVLVHLPLVVLALLRWRKAEVGHPLVWLLVIVLLPVLGAAAFLARSLSRAPAAGVDDSRA